MADTTEDTSQDSSQVQQFETVVVTAPRLPQTQLPPVTVTASRPPKIGIDAFLASFNQNDVARSNRFDVTIIAPALVSQFGTDFRNLTYRCENAQLPSRTFGTVEQKFGSNPTQKFPMHSSYNDLQLTFIVSGSMNERTLFDVWMEYINPTSTFDFSYKNDYTASISVTQYDLTNQATYVVNFINAYPVAVNQLDLDWANDGHHKLTVDFAYDYWQNEGVQNLPRPSSGNGGVGGGFSFQTISSTDNLY
jgi:hypothetical protein